MDQVKAYLKEYSYLKSILSLLHWDMETMMPQGAIEDRASRLSYVQGKLHSHLTAKKYVGLLNDLKGQKLGNKEKRVLKELFWDYDLNKAFPLKHVMELSNSQAMATHAWAEAKKNNSWKEFLPHLEKLIALKRRECAFFQVKRPYDALLRQHDKEFASEDIDRLFSQLRSGLLKVIATVKKDARFTDVEELKGPFELGAQKELSHFVARAFGLPEANSRLDISSHPFSINISPRDQRITTRYSTAHLDSLSSTMHEVGHALYELHLPLEWEGTPYQEAVSLSVHESQSRFWENIVGRSKEFCHFIRPEMARLFPKAMKKVDTEKLFLMMNRSHPGPIRVESPELYYNLHIIVRYEIEEMIFNQGLGAKDIPAFWNKKYRDYLDLKIKKDSEGPLQDSHWAGAAFGYFPTYALGNLISATLYRQMLKAIPGFKAEVKKGKFSSIKNYLVENVHSKGRTTTAKELVGELKVDDYIWYLQNKFKG